MDTGDTAWMLTSTALVMIMLPGLALFYGGLVRRKNVLSTIMHSFFGLAIVSVVWVLVGFSIAFGPDVNGWGLIGGLDFIGFNNVGQAPSTVYAVTIPFLLFAAFQLMFAAITPALITGAFAERKRFGAFVLFTVLWSILVYSPIAHWVWSVDGWLYKLGALDFAGGTVVHVSSGVSALIVAAAAAVFVTTKAFAARPPAVSAEPALKPNQPNQRRPAPRSVIVRSCGIALRFGYPSRLPSMIAHTSADTPAVR